MENNKLQSISRFTKRWLLLALSMLVPLIALSAMFLSTNLAGAKPLDYILGDDGGGGNDGLWIDSHYEPVVSAGEEVTFVLN